MQKLFYILLLILLIPVRLLASETIWNADNLPMVHLQDERKWVCNPDGVLSAQTVDSIDAIISSLHKTKGVEAIIVVVKHIENGDCYETGMALGRKYKVGKEKTQSGLIIMLSTEDRSYYILPGRGLEGVLPDITCHRIEKNIMVPLLKEQKWDEAMLHTIKKLADCINEEGNLDKIEEDDLTTEDLSAIIITILLMLLLFGWLIRYSVYKNCPNCKKRKLKATKKELLYVKNHSDYYAVTYTCSHCGHTTTKTEREPHQNHQSNGGGGIYMGGGGGGGFHGGSFGGGGFSGGGAGGRF